MPPLTVMDTFLHSWSLWLSLSIIAGIVIAYEVHWLLVRADYKEYKHCGGSLNLLRFRALREQFKADYRRQREKEQLQHKGRTLPVNLGAFVRQMEQKSDAVNSHP